MHTGEVFTKIGEIVFSLHFAGIIFVPFFFGGGGGRADGRAMGYYPMMEDSDVPSKLVGFHGMFP